ncbi:M36 family metallopeptidase [Nocardioides sp. GXQ0305]|uniref:M36 family metallopeptidase n=1 Tax=Nocardioides sp. GXQ0305 TaxID=3423912 RepID=UPI003D7DA75E
MRRTISGAIAGVAAAALGSAFLPMASATPPDEPGSRATDLAGGLLGTGTDHGDIDRRRGDLAPTTAQRAADRSARGRVRWNDLGTPAAVTADQGTVASGLPARPESTARAYLGDNATLFGLDGSAVADLETLAVTQVGTGAIVTMRQTIDGLPAVQGGLVTVAVRDGAVLHASSTLSRDTGSLPSATIGEEAAEGRAISAADLTAGETRVLRTREVAVPTPRDGARRAYEVVLAESSGHGAAYTVLIDAATGALLVRESLVDHADDNPTWDLFPATPPDYTTTERDTWCWTTASGCDDAVDNGASPQPWDVDPATGVPTATTRGNNAISGKSWSLPTNVPAFERTALPREDREYDYAFQNIWQEQKCDPAALTTDDGNDVDAATASLFAHHNRLHDFSYQLGFTEQTWNAQQNNFGRGEDGNDPEIGKAQSGATQGIRDNANQYSPPDGIAPWSNMYLWQPIAGGAYVPCVDGDFDGTVIGHEYTHMISNRMVAGPDAGLSGYQAGGMGESWSDLVAMEYLWELGERPKGDTPYVTGAYVTGDDRAGIRNYDMSRSTLNYSNVGYDVVGQSVHSEGEIWSTTNFTVRQAFIDRYGRGSGSVLRACFDGERAADRCPGSRRWIQLVFDAWLVPATGQVSMVDMRDAMLVADELRFEGANQDIIWNAFAERGLGEDASSAGPNDTDPVPSFSSPFADDAQVTFRPTGPQTDGPVRFYVGEYEDQSSPVADTDPATAVDDQVAMVPGRYEALAVGPSVGHHRFSFEVRAGQRRTIPVRLEENLAAAANGATATGDGADAGQLLDGTEATDWSAERADVAGLGVNVDLAGLGAHRVGRVTVSAFYESGSRFNALRRFAVEVCDATRGADCSDAASYDRVFVSRPDAFPGDGMRPTAPDLNAETFAIPRSRATHLRLEVLSNQCTGGPDFQGDQDNDPANNSDCPTGAPAVASVVKAAEFQAFRR